MGLDVDVKTRAIGAVCGLLGFVGSAVAQPTITNTTQGTTHATLADAVSASTNGDVIEIGEGVLYEQGLTLSNRSLTIRGVSASETILDGDHVVGRIFSVRSGSSMVFEKMTMRNGVAQPNGGLGGGAIRCGGDASIIVRDCVLDGNDDNNESFGAVSLATSGSSRFERCVFTNNTGRTATFGMIGPSGAATIAGCLFVNESTGEGVVQNYTDGELRIINCTFVDAQSPVMCILRNGTNALTNCAFDGSATAIVVDNGITTTSFCVFPGATGTNIDGLPTFVDAGSGDYRLAVGSLGIDVGDTLTASSALGLIDLGGAPRLNDDPATVDAGVPMFGMSIDAGAFEYAPATCAADFNEDGLVNTGDVLSFLNVYTAGCP